MLKYSSLIHVMNSTGFIFPGVICLTLDPVPQSDCHEPSRKDFHLAKAHTYRAHISFSLPFATCHLGSFNTKNPLHLHHHQVCPYPPLEMTKVSTVSGPYLKHCLGLLLFRSNLHSSFRKPPNAVPVKQPRNTTHGHQKPLVTLKLPFL